MPRLEDFQKGVPLNEELRRIRAGVMDEPEASAETAEAWSPDNVDRALTDAEREDLARLTMEPGWRVLKRLRTRTLHRMEKASIIASKQNPLGREREIALGWANLAMFQEQMRMDQAAVDGEIRKLKDRDQGAGNYDSGK
jgi:hypothetical protein